MAPRTFHAHRQVVHTAKQMAHELYAELMAGDNSLYADWKAQCEDLTPEKAEELFVQLLYPKLIEPARATLARLLANPTLTHLHEGIYTALQEDYLLKAGRTADGARRVLDVAGDGTVRQRKSPLN